MPLYDYKCECCDNTIEDQRMGVDETEMLCPDCGSIAKRMFPTSINIIVPNKHRSVSNNKKPDSHPLDQGVPFGEVPGDDDYKNINSPLSPKP